MSRRVHPYIPTSNWVSNVSIGCWGTRYIYISPSPTDAAETRSSRVGHVASCSLEHLFWRFLVFCCKTSRTPPLPGPARPVVVVICLSRAALCCIGAIVHKHCAIAWPAEQGGFTGCRSHERSWAIWSLYIRGQ